jgi:hypothetical protein
MQSYAVICNVKERETLQHNAPGETRSMGVNAKADRH